MGLTELLKNTGRALTLTAALYSCGDTNNYYENGEGNNNNSGDGRCSQLCERVWGDCGGLPSANYSFGTSYNNCLKGCPDFLEGVNRSPYAEEFSASLDCIIGLNDCDALERDACDMDEGDLFGIYSR